MIAPNYRRFPESLLYQLELVLGQIEDTFDYIRKANKPLWNLWKAIMSSARDNDRGKAPTPAHVLDKLRRSRTLARSLMRLQRKIQIEN